jgi:hypothetical protein
MKTGNFDVVSSRVVVVGGRVRGMVQLLNTAFPRVLVYGQALSHTIPDSIRRYLTSRAAFKTALTITHIEQSFET